MENDDKKEEMTEHEKLLEQIYQMDPLIAKAAEKLKHLSEDREVVKQYNQREEQLRKKRLERER
ncbi:hypothetical protein AB4Z22_28755 [Paenibacillus sp. TAF58]